MSKKLKPIMKTNNRFLTILLLGLLTTVVPFSIDMYLPAFPDIAKALGTNVSKVALSLSSFFMGIGIGQIIYGPLLDRFGRRYPMYIGLVLYCIASIACASTDSIEMLIVFRFVQALGACSATVAATAMVRDFFPPEENAKIFSFLMLVLSISPMLAPTIGSYISYTLGWAYIFVILTILIVLILIGVIFFLPQSRKGDKSISLRPVSIMKGYLTVIKEPYFYFFATIGGIAFGSLFTYISSSPGIFIEIYGLSQGQYGILFAVIAFGVIMATQVNNALLKYYKSERIILFSLIIQIVIGGLLLIISLAGYNQFWLLTSLLFVYLSSIGLIMPNASALTMKNFAENAGSASALMGFFQMGIGALATFGIGLINLQPTLAMLILIFGLSILGFVLSLFSLKLLKNSPKTKEETVKEPHFSHV
jgi:MFS transporter, DHA1 family, multidrug resistance protein